MFTGFDVSTQLDSDAIHPNAAGYQFMADRWYSAIAPLLH
jgi:lysophospholipase L1-like esterase